MGCAAHTIFFSTSVPEHPFIEFCVGVSRVFAVVVPGQEGEEEGEEPEPPEPFEWTDE